VSTGPEVRADRQDLSAAAEADQDLPDHSVVQEEACALPVHAEAADAEADADNLKLKFLIKIL